MSKGQLTIDYDAEHDWFTVTFPVGLSRNYGSLQTLLDMLKDYYATSKYKELS